jgi:disulfide bond formation protein DsbB
MQRSKSIAVVGVAIGGVALAVALGSEHFLGLIPCALCLVERWPYRIVIGLGLLAVALPARPARLLCWAIVLVLCVSAASGVLHVGVEQRWWPSPLPECTAPDLSGLSPAERFARMPLRPAKSCEDADYPIPFIPISFAQGLLIYALASAGLMAILLARTPRRYR